MTGEAGYMCPVCRQTLVRAVMDDREPIQVCQRCKGIFLARRAFVVTLVARRRAADRPSVIPPLGDRRELERRIACPQCGAVMLTDWYHGPGNIVIDTCEICDAVWLDAGEPIKNVPMSLRNDGHKILIQEPLEPEAAHFKILVEKIEGS